MFHFLECLSLLEPNMFKSQYFKDQSFFAFFARASTRSQNCLRKESWQSMRVMLLAGQLCTLHCLWAGVTSAPWQSQTVFTSQGFMVSLYRCSDGDVRFCLHKSASPFTLTSISVHCWYITIIHLHQNHPTCFCTEYCINLVVLHERSQIKISG